MGLPPPTISVGFATLQDSHGLVTSSALFETRRRNGNCSEHRPGNTTLPCFSSRQSNVLPPILTAPSSTWNLGGQPPPASLQPLIAPSFGGPGPFLGSQPSGHLSSMLSHTSPSEYYGFEDDSRGADVPQRRRIAAACTTCRKRKVRCVRPAESSPCRFYSQLTSEQKQSLGPCTVARIGSEPDYLMYGRQYGRADHPRYSWRGSNVAPAVQQTKSIWSGSIGLG